MTLVYDDGQNKSTRNWIFTLGDESWREIKSNIPYIMPVFLGGGVHIDGIIYFFSDRYYNSIEVQIVTFNFSTEKFRIISSLWNDNVRWIDCHTQYQLVEIEGKIAAVDSSSVWKERIQAHVWMLQSSPDETEEWVHKKLVFKENNFFCINGGNILLVNRINKPTFIFLFDMKKQWCRATEILWFSRKKDRIIGIYGYNEYSLYSL